MKRMPLGETHYIEDYDHRPLSGSIADFTYDDEEYREYAKILGVMPLEVARL